MQKTSFTPLARTWPGLLFFFSVSHLQLAVAQVFTLDTNQSSITISGKLAGYTVSAQSPGSLTTKYTGTIQTIVAGNTIQFVGQSQIKALNSGSWQPKSDGTAGSAPANYGATANAGFAVANAAMRNIRLDVTNAPVNLSNGQFDSRSLAFFFPTNSTSSAAYNVAALSQSGALPLSGYATNNIATLSSLATVGNQQILTIPVNALFKFSLLATNDTPLTLNGQLVAVRKLEAPLVLATPIISNQVLTLQWQAAPNQFFSILSSPDLISWSTNASNVTSSSTTYSWSAPATGSIAFFRLAQ